MPSVAIVGAGIGGLSAAVALGRAGVPVTVFERREQLPELGSGLTLSPNAIGVLDRLGLADEVLAIGAPIRALQHQSARGAVLKRVDVSGLAESCGAPFLGLRRPELLRLLAKHASSSPLQLGVRCTAVSDAGDCARVEFADREAARAAVAIAADGRDSLVRAAVDPTPLRYLGYTGRRGLSRFDDLEPGVSHQSYGPGTVFGYVGVGDGLVYWYASQNAPAGSEAERGSGRKQALLDRFRDWHHPVPALIEACDESAISATDILDLPRRERWGEGRFTLLGDAAHPVSPALGQGAGMAIEDAEALASALTAHDDAVAALRAYERDRIERTAMIVEASRSRGALAQWGSPAASLLREVMLRALPQRAALRQFEQVWRYAASAPTGSDRVASGS